MSRRRILGSTQKPYTLLCVEDAAFWSRTNQGSWRGEFWGKVVRKTEKIKAKGLSYEIRWWSSKDRKDPEFGCGLVEVVPT